MPATAVWHLSDEVLVHIFGFLPAEAVGHAASVCSRWASVAEDRRVWRGKSYLLEDPQGLPDALLVARLLPVLKKVSIRQGNFCKVYLSWESADFVVPDLRDEVVRSAVSSLATENLSIDFLLLEEASSNCLAVQLHRLRGLRAAGDSVPKEVAKAKLKALATTLSDNSLPDLQSVHIGTGTNECCRFIQNEGIAGGILRALTTCPALRQLSLDSLDIRFSLPHHTICKLSNVEVVELEGCDIELLSFLSLCPNLCSLSLTECDINMRLELSLKFALRSLSLRNLKFDSRLLDVLCLACPQLDRIAIHNCSDFKHSLRLGHCLPSNLTHLRLSSIGLSSDLLRDIVKRSHRLETLDLTDCHIESLSFLHDCAGLSELSVSCHWDDMLVQYHELGCLKNLQKLTLTVKVADIGALAEALRTVPLLEALDVKFTDSSTPPDLSFLRHCHRLRVLFVNSYNSFRNVDLYELTNMKELRKVVVKNLHFTTEDLEHFLDSMPQVEEMDIGLVGKEFNFSFLDHCHQLTSLGVTFDRVKQWRFAHPQCLERLRRLVLNRLPDEHLSSLAKLVRKMPRLEYLGLSCEGPNVLESWEWRRALLSLSSDS